MTIETYLSDAQVASRIGVNKATIWRWAKLNQTFPRPIKLGPQVTRWKLTELEAWEQLRASSAAA